MALGDKDKRMPGYDTFTSIDFSKREDNNDQEADGIIFLNYRNNYIILLFALYIIETYKFSILWDNEKSLFHNYIFWDSIIFKILTF